MTDKVIVPKDEIIKSTEEVDKSEQPQTKTTPQCWSPSDLIDLIRAVKFSNKDASMRNVHAEITTQMAARESFEFLSQVKLNDVKKVWKKALSGDTPKEGVGTAAAAAGSNSASESKKLIEGATNGVGTNASSGGILKFYTVGDGSVQSLAKDYTTRAAAEIAALNPKASTDATAANDLQNYVHCFLDVPMDVSGTRPHQALINFNAKNKTKSKKAKVKGKGKGKKRGKSNVNVLEAPGAGDNDGDMDEREIVKVQMAAPVPGMEKTPMLLYNESRTAKTFIHPSNKQDNGDNENADQTSKAEEDDYDKIRNLIIQNGENGVLSGGGTKAYFYCIFTRIESEQDIVSIDVVSGLANSQKW